MKNNSPFPVRFFVLAFLFTWTPWIPLVLGGFGILPLEKRLITALYVPITMVAVLGPGAAALICLRRERGPGAPSAYLKSFLDLKLGWKAWLLPPLVFGAVGLTAWLLPEAWGETRLDSLLPTPWVFPAYVLIMVFLGGGQEEIGWRGYASDRLEAALGPWAGTMVMGLLWAFWHLPLWFIPGSNQTFMNFGGFLLLTQGYSFFFSWIRKTSGGRPLSGLWVHGWANAFMPLWPALVLTAGAPQPRYWIWCGLVLLAGLAVAPLLKPKKPH